MASFGMTTVFGRKGKSAGGVGVNSALTAQFNILQNQLEGEGGGHSNDDYQAIADRALEYSMAPGITASQRIGWEVKADNARTKIRVNEVNAFADLDIINRETQESLDTNTQQIDNPINMLNYDMQTYLAKQDRIAQALDDTDLSEADRVEYYQELDDTIAQYNGIREALEDMENYEGGEPTSQFTLHLKTNGKGEIIGRELKRGVDSGYIPLSRTYNGLKVAGLSNTTKDGVPSFKLGNTDYSVPEFEAGSFSPADDVFVPSESIRGNQFAGTKAEFEYDSLGGEDFQQYTKINQGDFIRGGEKDLIYEKTDKGYKKHLHMSDESKQKLGLTAGNGVDVIPRKPQSFIDSIQPNVNETIDYEAITLDPTIPGNEPFIPEQPFIGPQQEPGSVSSLPQNQSLAQNQSFPAGRARTGGPTEAAPQSTGGIAQRTFESAKGFLGNLFS